MKHLKDFDQINEISSSTLDNAARKAEKRGFNQLANKFRSYADQTIYSSSEDNPIFTVVYNLSTENDYEIAHTYEFVARFVSYHSVLENIGDINPRLNNCSIKGYVKVIVVDPLDSHFSQNEVIKISLFFCHSTLVLDIDSFRPKRVLLLTRRDAKKFLDCVNKPRPMTNADPRTITLDYVNLQEQQD
jgi:hypothetical protein